MCDESARVLKCLTWRLYRCLLKYLTGLEWLTDLLQERLQKQRPERWL